MKTYYLDNNGDRVPVETIRISLITGAHSAFIVWLQEKLPDVRVEVNNDCTGDYVNQTCARRDKGARALIMGYWDKFCDTA